MKKLLQIILILILWSQAGAQTIDERLLPPGVPRQIQVDGTNIGGNNPVNLQDGDINVTNPSAGNIQFNINAGIITDDKLSGSGITTRSKLPAALGYQDTSNTWLGMNVFNGALRSFNFSILGSVSGEIFVKGQAAAGTYNFNLPTAAGTSGQPLLSGGGGAAPMTFGTLGLLAGGTNRSTAWIAARCVRVNDAGTALEPAANDCGTGGGTGGGHIIQYNGGALPQRATMNFTGGGVVGADVGAVTQITIAGPNQPLNSTLSIVAGFTPAADKIMFFNGSASGALADLTPFGRTVIAGTNAGGVRASLGLIIGTDVQAHTARLDSLTTVSSAGNQAPFFLAADQFSVYDLTPFSRTVLGNIDAAHWRTAIGLDIGTNVQGYSSRLAEISALPLTNNRLLGSTPTSFGYYSLPGGSCEPLRFDSATYSIACGTYPVGSISGTQGTFGLIGTGGNTINSGALSEDATNVNSSKPIRTGVQTNNVGLLRGSNIVGSKNYILNRNIDGAEVAVTTGSLPAGNAAKLGPQGEIVDGGLRTKTCIIENDTQSGAALGNSQITGRCDVDQNSVVLEVAVYASGGTPSVLLERWRPSGSLTADLLSAALSTGASGGYACVRSTTGQSCLAGITSSNSITTVNQALSAGDVIRVKSATAGGVATWFHVKLTMIY